MDHWVGITTKRFDAGVQRQHRTQEYYNWTKALLGTQSFLFTFLLNFWTYKSWQPNNIFSNRLQRTYVKIQRYAISIYKDLPMNISWTYQMYINRKSKRNKVNYSITSLVNLFFFAAPLLRQWRQSRRVIYIYNI